MQEHERAEFVGVVAAMASTFRQEATEAMFEGYWMGLSDLKLPAIKQAIAKAMRESKFMPSCVELRTLAGEMPLADRALKAWDAVQRAVKRPSCHHSVNFDDAVVNAAIRNLGGWMNLDDRMKGDDRKWTRKEFIEVYESLCRTGIAPGSGGHLIGFHEYDSRFGRYVRLPLLSPPVLISCGLPPHRPGIVPAVEHAEKPPPAQIEFVEGVVAAVGQPGTQHESEVNDEN